MGNGASDQLPPLNIGPGLNPGGGPRINLLPGLTGPPGLPPGARPGPPGRPDIFEDIQRDLERNRKRARILAFEGGGTRAIMELAILDDLMKMVTLVKRKPGVMRKILFGNDFNQESALEFVSTASEESIISSLDEQNGTEIINLKAVDPELAALQYCMLFKDDNLGNPLEISKSLRQELDSIDKPDHPSGYFDMIVAASTSAIIPFALIGGGEKRKPMSVHEVMDLYKDAMGLVFSERVKEDKQFQEQMDTFLKWTKGKFSVVPDLQLKPYSMNGLNKVLKERFGEDTKLTDFKKNTLFTNEGDFGCIAAVVAHKYQQDPWKPDLPEIFTSFPGPGRERSSSNVIETLKASSDSPLFFKTPSKVGKQDYIDAGIVGFCPVPVALEEMAHIRGKDLVMKMAVSIGPPDGQEQKLSDIQTGGRIQHWMKYHVIQFNEGQPSFREAMIKEKKGLFHRLQPQSKESKKFKLDDLDMAGMIKAIKKESTEEQMYMWNLIYTALTILLSGKTAYQMTVAQNQLVDMVLFDLIHRKKTKFDLGAALSCVWINRLTEIGNAPINEKANRYLRARSSFNVGICYQELYGIKDNRDLFQHMYCDDSVIDFKDQSIQALRDAKQLYQVVFGPTAKNRVLAVTIGKLANAMVLNGSPGQAIEFYHQALGMFKHVNKDDADKPDMAMADCLFNLGQAYAVKKDHDTAVKFLQESLDIQKLDKANNSKIIVKTLIAMGVSGMAEEEEEYAVKHWNEALELAKSTDNKDDAYLVQKLLDKVQPQDQDQGQKKKKTSGKSKDPRPSSPPDPSVRAFLDEQLAKMEKIMAGEDVAQNDKDSDDEGVIDCSQQ